jgi:type VI secretion system protein ImpL
MFAKLKKIKLPVWLPLMLGLTFVSILIWFVGPLIAVGKVEPFASWLARLIIIALIFMCGGLHLWLKARKARKTNSALVEDLAAGDSADIAPSDTSKEDLAAIQQRFSTALDKMRSSKMGKDKAFVYQLPWYIIIGPPGAGKTTALVNSGLNFPVSDEAGVRPVQGVGGTRNCDWWFTDQAILIDTAGRYTTQDSNQQSDAKGWSGFLDILKKHRPRQPLTGILVAISITDLLGGDESHALAHAKAIRMRINELHQRFSMRLPVYVLLTKLDLLAGFSEFFDDLDASDREQVWGTTFALADSRNSNGVTKKFEDEFLALVERLNERLFDRMHIEQDMERRSLIFGFPQQFASLRGPLVTLVNQLGKESKFDSTPLIRGVYFNSATQLGRPIDRLLGAISTKFGVSQTTAISAQASGRSYFLQTLLGQVVFNEANLAGKDPKAERRSLLMRTAAIGGAGLVTAGLLAGWGISYYRNGNYLGQLFKQGGEYRKNVAALPAGAISDGSLDSVLPTLNQARAFAFAPTAMTQWRDPGFSLGLGQKKSVRPQVNAAYVNVLNRQFLPRLLVRLEDQLRTSLSTVTQTPQSQEQMYDALRIYLMLGRAPGAPLKGDDITGWMMQEWDAVYPGSEFDGTRGALRDHLQAMLSSPMLPPKLDRDLILQARDAVRSLSPGDRAYRRMRNAPELQALTPFTLAGYDSEGLLVRRSGMATTTGVPGMFRASNFYKHVFLQIGKTATSFAGEGWVMGEPGGANVASMKATGALKDDIIIAYLREFVRIWDEQITDIGIGGTGTIQARMSQAALPNSPIRVVMKKMAQETDLSPPGLGKASKVSKFANVASIFSSRIYSAKSRADQVTNAAAYAGSSGNGAVAAQPGELDEVIAHFKWLRELVGGPAGLTPLDRALGALAGAGDAMAGAAAAGQQGDPNLIKAEQAKAMAATASLAAATNTLPPVARDMLTGFASGSSSQLNQAAKQQVVSTYASMLAPQCRSIVSNVYPFSPAASRAVAIDDFSRLFRPGGLLDGFVQSDLKQHIDTSRGAWTVGQSGRNLNLDGSSIREFQKADRIKNTFFKPGDIRPNVRFVIEPESVGGGASQVDLTVDGIPVSFDGKAKRAVELRWPGNIPGVQINFTPADQSQPVSRTWAGEWGLFQLLRDAKILQSTSTGMRFKVSADTFNATYSLRLASAPNPFTLEELQKFNCPAKL